MAIGGGGLVIKSAAGAGVAVPAGRRPRDPQGGVLRGGALVGVAPAKINLTLEVIGRRPDGFHELESVLAPLALSDELWVRQLALGRGAAEPQLRSARPAGDRLSICGADDIPTEDNLVLRAAALLRAEAGRPLSPLALRLLKRIPAAAGLGGGSSDALAALDLAAAAWRLRLGIRRRMKLAATLGSDVPFFALGGWALVGGRGERLRRLPPPKGGPLGVLLVVPTARLSTRDVFAALDATDTVRLAGSVEPGGLRQDACRRMASPGRAHRGATRHLAAVLRRGAPASEVADLQPANDLFPAAVVLLPGLDHLRCNLGNVLGRPVHLTGSGPTLVVLYPSASAARRAATAVRAAVARGALQPPGGNLQVIATITGGEA
ncbi:MAG: 4-(cytidine 5'-diphospho)-2-C-methyl-D-erythritol kinase [Candidatus Limnocylindrales bacterium]